MWHNGEDEETLAVVEEHRDHPAVHRFHHSPQNVGLGTPTNWVWREGTARFVSKVDDDCMPQPGWIATLAHAHEANPEFGVIGCSRYPDEDFLPDVAARKIQTFAGGHQLLRNLWIQGSGYLLKREWIERYGALRDGQTFTQYCKQLAVQGLVNGWYFPFVREEHMDDPRSPHTFLRSDADLERWLPLSAKRNGVTTLDQWREQQRQSAYIAQTASVDVREYRGGRKLVRNMRRRLQRGRPGWAGRAP